MLISTDYKLVLFLYENLNITSFLFYFNRLPPIANTPLAKLLEKVRSIGATRVTPETPMARASKNFFMEQLIKIVLALYRQLTG